MKSLLGDLKPHRKEIVLAPLFKMLEATFELFVPLVMKHMMDDLIPAGETKRVLGISLILLLLAAVGLVTAVTAQYFSAKAATGFAATIREKVFRHVQTFSFSRLDTVGASTVITRMTSDVNQIQNGLNLTLRLFLRSPFIVFGAIVMAFIVNPRLAWIFVIVVPLLALIVFAVMLFTLPMYGKVQKVLDGVTEKTRENLTGVRAVRAFRLEATETEAFIENNRLLTALQKAVGRISAFLNPVTQVLINLGIVAILWFGGRSVAVGALSAGAVIALVNYMNQILVELIKMANLIIQMTKGASSMKRVASVLETAPDDEPETVDETAGNALPETEELPDPDAPAVRFRRVSVKYENSGGESLSDVSFEAKRGETVGIIGGTGSGKSTLVSLIPGLYPVYEGNVEILGKDVSLYGKTELRKKVGFVMQKARLFKGTVRDVLRMGKEDATDEEMWEALKNAEAADFVREKEGGLDAAVEEEGRNFSGGQKQRLSIARALIRKPEILILDDSSSALDFATDAALRENLRALGGTRTTFIVSQRTASIRNADRILVLDDGKLVGNGTHDELIETCPVYREIHESQFH